MTQHVIKSYFYLRIWQIIKRKIKENIVNRTNKLVTVWISQSKQKLSKHLSFIKKILFEKNQQKYLKLPSILTMFHERKGFVKDKKHEKIKWSEFEQIK